jgi:pimeloyl-ACP methyl ester carboxylesterase
MLLAFDCARETEVSKAGKGMHLALCHAVAALLMTAASPVQAQPQKLVANGLSFGYLDVGSGPTVILVHGSISDFREWSHQMAPLAQRYRVIAYSRRYHWPNASPTSDADATLERQAEDLAAIMGALKIGSAHVVGHSYGGATALFLARRHPELVRTLVLAEPAVGGVLGELPKDDPIYEEGRSVRAEVKEAFADGSAERIVRTYAARVAPGEFENAPREAREMFLANVAAFRLDFGSPRPAFTCDDAGRIAVPALVIAGSRSAMGLQRIAETLARCLKTGSLGATHWMESDHPQAFNEAVLSFLERH